MIAILNVEPKTFLTSLFLTIAPSLGEAQNFLFLYRFESPKSKYRVYGRNTFQNVIKLSVEFSNLSLYYEYLGVSFTRGLVISVIGNPP